MEYIIGAALGLGIPVAATCIGLDRDRALYPVMTIVTASYYDLFALLGGSVQALGWDSVMMIVFIAAAVAGLKPVSGSLRPLWQLTACSILSMYV